MSVPLIELKGIHKSFGGIKALQGVDLAIEKAKVICLAGENGSGKSTLIKIISGALTADSGTIAIDGKVYKTLRPIDAIRQGIQVIYQDFSVFPNLSVAENIALNHELQNRVRIVNWRRIRKIAEAAVQQIGVPLPLDEYMEQQPVANKQLAAICRAIIHNARLIIMDEPTTALTANEVKRLFAIVRNLRDQGISVLFVNHKLEEMYEIAEEVHIIRNGLKVAEGPIKTFDRQKFVKYMTGRDLAETQFIPEKLGDVLLEIKKLILPGFTDEINLQLRRGEILGVTGLLGSGRTELGNTLFGVQRAKTGEVYVDGQPVPLRSVKHAVAGGIAYVPEDRLTEGLFLNQSISHNTLVTVLRSYLKKLFLDRRQMAHDVQQWIEKLHVATASADLEVKSLSGGNQQKVVLSKWLATKPKLLILNGPTVGVDVGAKADIHHILRGLARENVGIIIISDDIPELLQNCNRIVMMRAGRISDEYQAGELSEVELAKELNKEQ